MRSISILKISLAVLLFISPAFTQNEFTQMGEMIDDAQVIINQSNSAYQQYMKCFNDCDSNNLGYDCYYQCSNELSENMKTVISLFKVDPAYNFDEVENRFFTEDAIFEVETDLSEQAKDLKFQKMMNTVKLFALEKHSRASFDPLYLAATDVFEAYSQCLNNCVLGDADVYTCMDGCSTQYQKSLEKEMSYSLGLENLQSFTSITESWIQYTNCMRKATSQKEQQACNHLLPSYSLNEMQSLVTVQLNNQEKAQVQQYYNQVRQVTNQVKQELPARKQQAQQQLVVGTSTLKQNAGQYKQVAQSEIKQGADQVNAQLPAVEQQVVQEIDQAVKQVIANLPQAQAQINGILEQVADQATNNMTAYQTKAASIIDQLAAVASDAVNQLDTNQKAVAKQLGLTDYVNLIDTQIQMQFQNSDNTLIIFILSVVAALVIGGAVFFGLRRAKKQASKAQLVKPSELKRQRKEKILDEEEDTFPIESTL